MALLIPLCAAVFGLLLLYLGKSIIYNLYFHPFRKYPGPALARVSRIWSRRANLNGLKYMRIHQAHQKHGKTRSKRRYLVREHQVLMRIGPIVRIGPNELSFANPVAVKDIYTSDSFVKEESFYVRLPALLAPADASIFLLTSRSLLRGDMKKSIFSASGRLLRHPSATSKAPSNTFIISNPDAHTQRRKLLSRGYSQGTVLSFEQEISTKLQTMFDQISTEITHSKPVDIYQWAQLFSFDVVCTYIQENVMGFHPKRR